MRCAKSIHSRLGNCAHQIALDLHRVGVPRQAQPLAEPGDVRIDDHAAGNAERRAQHHVGRLAPDARQLHQRVQVLGHLAADALRPAVAQQPVMLLALLRKKPVL